MGKYRAPIWEADQATALHRLAHLVTRHPRVVIGGWLILVVCFAILGTGLDRRLSDQPPLVNGTASKRAYELSVRQFGVKDAAVVALHGPERDLRLESRALARRLKALPGVLVLAPWERTKELDSLSPSTQVTGLFVNFDHDHNRDPVAQVERAARASIRPPVQANLAGSSVLVDSFTKATAQSAATCERLAIPILLLVLFVVFRSVVAAAIPVFMGASVVASARGLIDLFANAINIESFVLGVVGMMGLALGVDYSLLVVSRFREGLRLSNNVNQAVYVTVLETGKAIIPAGAGIMLAMLLATWVVSSPLVASVAFAVIAVTFLSMVSALTAVPALLVILGPNIDRWSIKPWSNKYGLAIRWSELLSKRPLPVLAAVLFLVACSAWALTLDTQTGSVELLPPDNPGRKQQEAVERDLGPGWAAPIEIMADGGNQPILALHRLNSLLTFQRHIERDPSVSAMVGLAPVKSGMMRMARNDLGHFTGEYRISQLRSIMKRLRMAGTAVGASTAIANNLNSTVALDMKSVRPFSNGLEATGAGSMALVTGLDKLLRGSKELAHGVSLTAIGSSHMASALDQAHARSRESTANIQVLEKALHAGGQRLRRLHPVLRLAGEKLAIAWDALKKMTIGREDPNYADLSEAIEGVDKQLTGRNPDSGVLVNPAVGGVDPEIKLAQNQLDLSVFLVKQGRRSNQAARRGLGRLAQGSARLNTALGKLANGSQRILRATSRLAGGGKSLTLGLGRLASGASDLGSTFEKLQKGSAGFRTHLQEGAQRLHALERAVPPHTISGTRGTSVDSAGMQLPELSRSGYFYLAALDDARPRLRRRVGELVNLDQGGTVARMLVIPRHPSTSAATQKLVSRLDGMSRALGHKIDADIVVGGTPVAQNDINGSYRSSSPLLRLALMLVTVIILLFVLRSITVPLIAAVLNLLTVAACLGLAALLFDSSLIGGPGFVDATVIPVTVMVTFALALDYEVFVFARMREEYLRTGSPSEAATDGLQRTARVVSGAATVMILIFLLFAISPVATIRNFGVIQALGVAIDAFVIRLIVVPALMRTLGRWAWWVPRLPFDSRNH